MKWIIRTVEVKSNVYATKQGHPTSHFHKDDIQLITMIPQPSLCFFLFFFVAGKKVSVLHSQQDVWINSSSQPANIMKSFPSQQLKRPIIAPRLIATSFSSSRQQTNERLSADLHATNVSCAVHLSRAWETWIASCHERNSLTCYYYHKRGIQEFCMWHATTLNRVNRHERPREKNCKTSPKWGESLYKEMQLLLLFFCGAGSPFFCSNGDIKQQFQHQTFTCTLTKI